MKYTFLLFYNFQETDMDVESSKNSDYNNILPKTFGQQYCKILHTSCHSCWSRAGDDWSWSSYRQNGR